MNVSNLSPSQTAKLGLSPYEQVLMHQLERFPGIIEGNPNALFCVVSSNALSPEAKQALDASAQRLGYSLGQRCFMIINESVDTHELPPQTSEVARALVHGIEAIDPLAVVITDYDAVSLASAGYNKPLSLESHEQLLGRSCCCFSNFTNLLATQEGKRKAWKCLKRLPSLVRP